MRRHIGVGTITLSKKTHEYIHDVLTKNRLSYGAYCEKFERLFAKIHQVKYATLCNSGTSALQVSLHALKQLYSWNDGDEVLVPAITFVADINVVLHNNLTPILIDADPTYLDIDITKITEKITPRTRAIIVTHLFGQPANISEIKKIAKKHKLKIIEDSCETMFAKHKGIPVGTWGDVACFSTYSAHLITTGVGGIVTTNNPKINHLVTSLINHGRDSAYLKLEDDDQTTSKKFSHIVESRFLFKNIGYSFRLSELEAAIGLAQLESFHKIIEPRQKNASYLIKKLSDLNKELLLPQLRTESEHVFMVFPIVVQERKINVNNLILFLEKNGIETRPILPIINQPAYKSLRIQKKDYPVANRITSQGFYIGCHQDLSKQDLDYISEKLHEFIQKNA